MAPPWLPPLGAAQTHAHAHAEARLVLPCLPRAVVDAAPTPMQPRTTTRAAPRACSPTWRRFAASEHYCVEYVSARLWHAPGSTASRVPQGQRPCTSPLTLGYKASWWWCPHPHYAAVSPARLDGHFVQLSRASATPPQVQAPRVADRVCLPRKRGHRRQARQQQRGLLCGGGPLDGQQGLD